MASEAKSQKPAVQISVRIDASFASEIQRGVAMKLLKDFLQAWKTNVEEADKRNRVTIAKG